uniref:helix-turn-helix domain-containing protein n=1 Tax=Bifidobacterium pullorum TaxID=78448 RepID=UPI003AF56FDF
GLSVGRFIRVFREATGLSPKRYLTSIRMSEARMLLESTDYPIAEVADIVGYDNPLYFSRVFRAHVGMSPSQCRQEAMRR